VTVAGRALRVVAGGALAWCVTLAAAAPEFPLLCKAAALLILAITLRDPRWGLVLTAAAAPAGALAASAPARAAELFVWALMAGWLLAVWRPLSTAGWPRQVMLPLALYAGALVASWLSLTIGGAAGVPGSALPEFILRAIALNHVVLASPEAETWTLLQNLAGLAVFGAAIGITRRDPGTVRFLGWAIAASMTMLAVATIAYLWADGGYRSDFLRRYAQGTRFSLSLADVNAAGSLYALAAVVALGYAWWRPAQRLVWVSVLAMLAPALWLSGSRSAYVAIAAGAVVLAGFRYRWQPSRRRMLAVASLSLAMVLAAGLLVNPPSGVEGSVEQSMNLRSQFFLTSARMFASAPVFGVGVGRFWDRSAEFMTPELRRLYGNENAHNYFAQQFVELGLVGGLLFLWLLGTVLWRGWSRARQSPADTSLHALYAGTAAYVLTCLTGHPLLVPEAAIPFWAALGVLAGASSGTASLAMPSRMLATAAAVILAAGIGRAAMVYTRPADPPPEHGFHGVEVTRDGQQFRWMTRHAVMYIPEGPGFLRLSLRAPGWPAPRPVVLETSIGGRVVDRREVPADTWTTWVVPARPAAGGGFRRVDFRVNQQWLEDIKLGQRTARRPISVMSRPITWIPLR
jgi:O-antigen ligase